MLEYGTARIVLNVLKNFPTEALLKTEVAHCADDAHYTALEYYWLFRYELKSQQ